MTLETLDRIVDLLNSMVVELGLNAQEATALPLKIDQSLTCISASVVSTVTADVNTMKEPGIGPDFGDRPELELEIPFGGAKLSKINAAPIRKKTLQSAALIRPKTSTASSYVKPLPGSNVTSGKLPVSRIPSNGIPKRTQLPSSTASRLHQPLLRTGSVTVGQSTVQGSKPAARIPQTSQPKQAAYRSASVTYSARQYPAHSASSHRPSSVVAVSQKVSGARNTSGTFNRLTATSASLRQASQISKSDDKLPTNLHRSNSVRLSSNNKSTNASSSAIIPKNPALNRQSGIVKPTNSATGASARPPMARSSMFGHGGTATNKVALSDRTKVVGVGAKAPVTSRSSIRAGSQKAAPAVRSASFGFKTSAIVFVAATVLARAPSSANGPLGQKEPSTLHARLHRTASCRLVRPVHLPSFDHSQAKTKSSFSVPGVGCPRFQTNHQYRNIAATAKSTATSNKPQATGIAKPTITLIPGNSRSTRLSG